MLISLSVIGSKTLIPLNTKVFTQIKQEDFISITDMAKLKNSEVLRDIIKNWMRSKNTIELLGLWEKFNNPNFKQVKFDLFSNEAGYNHFVLHPLEDENFAKRSQYKKAGGWG